MTATLTLPVRRNATSTSVSELRYSIEPTSLGPMLVVSTSRRLRAIEFADSEAELQRRAETFHGAIDTSASELIEAATRALIQHIELTLPLEPLPVDLIGTAFQKRVWQTLMELPIGCVISYSDLARTIGQPKATRAVAAACAANKLAIAIPCHRVIRRDGQLGGYRWGLQRKRTLLERERSATRALGQTTLW